MSETSLFAELIKHQNHRKLIQVMNTKEGGEQKGKENVEPDASTSSSSLTNTDMINHSEASSSSQSLPGNSNSLVPTSSICRPGDQLIHNGAAKVPIINLDESPVNNKLSNIDKTDSAKKPSSINRSSGNDSVNNNNRHSNSSSANELSRIKDLNKNKITDRHKAEFKRLSTGLTKLPLPPGINLEDINSPTSPCTPPDTKPTRISITKDLPMPPCKFKITFVLNIFLIKNFRKLILYFCTKI